MGNAVSLVKTKGPEENLVNSISQAIDLVDFKPVGNPKSVVIKPNLCYYWDYTTGQTTDPRVVSAIIDLMRKRYGEIDVKVAEADATAMRTRHVFPALGYEKLAKEKDVKLLNLSTDVLQEKTVTVRGREISYKVPQVLVNSDLFINVPKLKIMPATKITCAMKNIFGCIGFPKKITYHPFLNEAIVGINKILRPHLTIVDGIVAFGRYPIKLDVIIAGVDSFSVDWVASQIMGYNPARVEFLKIAIKEKLANPKGIVTKGESIAELKKAFPKPSIFSSNLRWGQSFLLKAYQKASGDIIPPQLEEA